MPQIFPGYAVKWGVTERVKTFYDELASNYHLIFEDWEASIKGQAAVLGSVLERVFSSTKLRILDSACGIGTQTVGLASCGYWVTACDLSSAAVKRMCVEASQKRLDVQGFVADLLDLTLLPEGDFEAVICMDNALPHLDGQDHIAQGTTQIRRKLRPGGLFVASIRDYDVRVREKPVVQGPAFYTDDEDEASFIKCGTGSMIVAIHSIFT
jgi:glycine/sarcosine N-methyltransferase